MAHPGARFSELGELYELIYQFKDYAGDAARLAGILEEAGVPAGSRILEAACGTGTYLRHLPQFERHGFDLDPSMLAVARRTLPGVPLWIGDMRTFSVEEPMDAALLLFGGIGYVPEDDLDAALAHFARAIRPGGVLVLEPWVEPQDFRPGVPQMAVVDTPYLKICRQCIPRRDGDTSVLTFHYLVARPGFAVEHQTEENRLVLRTDEALRAALERHFAEVELREDGFMEGGRLFLCRTASASSGPR